MRLLIRAPLVALAVALPTACFAPGEPPPCNLRCGPGGLCPEGTRCQDDGYCHLPGSPACGDAAVPALDGGDSGDGAVLDGGTRDGEAPTAVVAVSVGPRNTCLARADKSAWCMGANDVGQIGDGSLTARYAPTRLAGSFRILRPAYFGTCGISDAGALLCWGSNSDGRLGLGQSPGSPLPTEPLPGTSWLDVALGFSHGCGVQQDGSLWCWGENLRGQVGSGGVSGPVPTPVQIAKGPFSSVSAANYTTCALSRDDVLLCWGDNSFGQVGNGRGGAPGAVEAAPVRIDGSFRAVSVGDLHACAVGVDGRLSCWGASDEGQAGAAGGTFTRPTLASPDATWVEVASGARHTCARRQDGSIFCMGDDDRGQSGGGGSGGAGVAMRRVGSDSDWSTIAAGGFTSCGLRKGGQLSCWGANGDGQLGQGVAGNHDRPFHVDDGWLQLAFGGNFGCGLKNDGALYCWGHNAFGQLGVGDYLSRARATRVGAGTYARLAAGRYHVCAITAKAELECWGGGDFGQTAGAASKANRPVSADVGKRLWIDVAAGDASSCGITSDNRLRCWGSVVRSSTITEVGSKVPNWSAVAGECALADTRLSCDLSTPEAVELVPGTQWRGLGEGGFLDAHACAIRSDGTLWCWGDNTFGQIGDGTQTSRPAPVRVGGGLLFTAVAAGAYFTVAIGIDGKLYSFGARGPRLGNGGADAPVPTLAQGDTDWIDVAAGDNAACAIKGAARERWCWGEYDALGDGTGFYPAPTPVP